MPEIVDVNYSGIPRAVGAWIDGGVIIDPGPSPGLDHLLAGLGGDQPRAVLLTHIHLDHAGATGHLAARFPELKVYVHEIGAPHIADPERLVASSKRVFGDRFAPMGEVLPVPSERIVALTDGDIAEGFEVIHTPGHAGNHVCFLQADTGDAFVGDVAGVSIEPGPGTVMPTPPPELDIDSWLGSIDRIAERSPATLRLTHFGTVRDPEKHLGHCRELLRRYGELAQSGDRSGFDAALEAEATTADEASTLVAVVSPDDAWAGLERWREKFPETAA
jgi:glyoxylase-like metal-dependent hydrolase (beta-lactamase superfamily II)